MDWVMTWFPVRTKSMRESSQACAVHAGIFRETAAAGSIDKRCTHANASTSSTKSINRFEESLEEKLQLMSRLSVRSRRNPT